MNKFASSAFLTIVFAFYAVSKYANQEIPIPITPEFPVPSSSSSDSSDIFPYLDSSSLSSFSSLFSSFVSSSVRSMPVIIPPRISSAPTVHSVVASSTPPQPSSRRQPISRTPKPTPISSKSSAPQGMYKDGVYTSPSFDAYYGNVQIQVSVQGGAIASVQFLDHPQGRGESDSINARAMPKLISETLKAQKYPVNAVSGATYTSQAYNQSLASVLAQAKA